MANLQINVPPATQDEVDAGTVTNKYVSPKTLADWPGGGGGGAVTSVNGQTGVVVLNAENIGAAGTADSNSFTGPNHFTQIPEVEWEEMTTGAGKTPELNKQYYITSFTANTVIDSYVGTPVNGSQVIYWLYGCNGIATFTFPPAQRSGDPTGTSTILSPTPGTHKIVFTYVNGAWYYQDDIVLTGVAVYGSNTSPIISMPYTGQWYEAYNAVYNIGASGYFYLPPAKSSMNLLIRTTGTLVNIKPSGSQVIDRNGVLQNGGSGILLAAGAGNFVALVSYEDGYWTTLGFTPGAISQSS